MADTTSSLLQLLLMGDGLHPNDWGDQTNTNLQKLESAIAATEGISVASSLTLTGAQSNNAILSLSGSLSANTVVTVPALSKVWLVVNGAAMNGFTLTFTTGVTGGATLAIQAGATLFVYCDGKNVSSASANLANNTVLANLGSGTQGVTYSQLLSALNLNTVDAPVFASASFDGPAGTPKQTSLTTTSKNRWVYGVDNSSETGANAGANFFVNAYADDGVTILGTFLSVVRSTLAATFNGAATFVGNLTCNQTVNAAAIQQGGNPLVPAGTVIAFAGSVAPNGWLECNGAAVSRTTYAALFGECGTYYGTGDGSTTFNLPDYRGQFLRGWDHGKGVDSGRNFATYQADGVIDHNHNYYEPSGGSAVASGTGAIGNPGSTSTATSNINGAAGGGTETRPKNWSVLYCIKY